MDIQYLEDHPHVIPTLARWSYEEWSDLHPQRTLEDVERLFYERMNKDNLPLCLVAFDEDTVAGMVCLKPQDLETRPQLSPWLATLYVDTPYRRQGIGSALVRAIEHKAVALGIKRLYLYTPKTKAFYAKRGWKTREHTVYQECPVTVMEKELLNGVSLT